MTSELTTKWINHFFKVAESASELSKDPRTKVGAVLVNPTDNTIIATGFNGFPRGIDDTVERYSNRETKHKLVCHAEVNAIINAARNGAVTKGSVLFVTMPPCITCAKIIIQAGVSALYFQDIEKVKNEIDIPPAPKLEPIAKKTGEVLRLFIPKKHTSLINDLLTKHNITCSDCTGTHYARKYHIVTGTIDQFKNVIDEMYKDYTTVYAEYTGDDFDTNEYLTCMLRLAHNVPVIDLENYSKDLGSYYKKLNRQRIMRYRTVEKLRVPIKEKPVVQDKEHSKEVTKYKMHIPKDAYEFYEGYFKTAGIKLEGKRFIISNMVVSGTLDQYQKAFFNMHKDWSSKSFGSLIDNNAKNHILIFGRSIPDVSIQDFINKSSLLRGNGVTVDNFPIEIVSNQVSGISLNQIKESNDLVNWRKDVDEGLQLLNEAGVTVHTC